MGFIIKKKYRSVLVNPKSRSVTNTQPENRANYIQHNAMELGIQTGEELSPDDRVAV